MLRRVLINQSYKADGHMPHRSPTAPDEISRDYIPRIHNYKRRFCLKNSENEGDYRFGLGSPPRNGSLHRNHDGSRHYLHSGGGVHHVRRIRRPDLLPVHVLSDGPKHDWRWLSWNGR